MVWQRLRHGKLLTRAVYPFFVSTWNALVSFAENLRGDGDIFPDGLIEIDRTDPTHPVIRFRTDKLALTGGGAACGCVPRPFRMEPGENGWSVTDCDVYGPNGFLCRGADYAVRPEGGAVFAHIVYNGATNAYSVTVDQNHQRETGEAVFALWEIDAETGAPTRDLRPACFPLYAL